MKDEASIGESDVDARYITDQIILKCGSLTGCEIPASDFFAKNISDALMSFMVKFGYSELSLSEILFALEMNMPHRFNLPSGIDIEPVEFNGKSVNVNYIAKCLSNYMVIRILIFRKFENLIDGIE